MRSILVLLAGLLAAATAFAGGQPQHDRRTNYDGYGSAHSRYQNMILMKPHDSILKGGKLEYWNSLDEYYYQEKRSKAWDGERRGKKWRRR